LVVRNSIQAVDKKSPTRGQTVITASVHGLLQASSFRERGDKTQQILVISSFREFRSYVTANWGKIQKSGYEKL